MKITMEQIAKEASVSRSTVSKALNNCVNVDRETKSRILAIAKAYGYATRHMEETGYAIAAVLPVNPSYFWREAMVGLREALLDAPDCTCIYALYSALNQEKEFLQCLEDAVRKSTKVLIAAAPSSDLCPTAAGGHRKRALSFCSTRARRLRIPTMWDERL
ncbi:MAG: LacI family DNA-binding transcriptional regulator [Bianqueaceae bacterium]